MSLMAELPISIIETFGGSALVVSGAQASNVMR